MTTPVALRAFYVASDVITPPSQGKTAKLTVKVPTICRASCPSSTHRSVDVESFCASPESGGRVRPHRSNSGGPSSEFHRSFNRNTFKSITSADFRTIACQRRGGSIHSRGISPRSSWISSQLRGDRTIIMGAAHTRSLFFTCLFANVYFLCIFFLPKI